jgi:hypothetical protein
MFAGLFHKKNACHFQVYIEMSMFEYDYKIVGNGNPPLWQTEEL